MKVQLRDLHTFYNQLGECLLGRLKLVLNGVVNDHFLKDEKCGDVMFHGVGFKCSHRIDGRLLLKLF